MPHDLAQRRQTVNHGQSVLDVCFSPDGSKLFSGGCDNAVRMYQLGKAPHISVRIGFHDKGVKGVGYIRSSNLVVSGGWDSKLKFWDQRQPQPVGVFELHERVYGLDVCDNLLVVATAGRHIITYDCSGQPREHSRIESPLAYQTRCLTSFPDSTGFAVGGIDGRVGIQYLSKDAAKENFAFFCHRQGSDVSAVNAIAFHVSEAYATVGADGGVNFWEKNSRSCLKSFDRIGRPVSCAAFNTKGDLFAYASSYDWSKGRAYAQSENEIFVHRVRDDEILPKSERAVGFKR